MPETMSADSSKTWQQTKSEMTRTSILDAAVSCFYKLGYSNTTTDNIASKAGVSRGAMLHHFPTRFELIKAAVGHLSSQRLALFESKELEIQRSGEHTHVGEGIDVYWKLLNTPAFVVMHELKVAARTDKKLKKILIPALEEFSNAFLGSVQRIFPDLAQSEAFERNNFLTVLLLEGMAVARLIDGSPVPEEMLISWLKQELLRSYADVLGSE
jgi:AcrR family transcriptional regulator